RRRSPPPARQLNRLTSRAAGGHSQVWMWTPSRLASTEEGTRFRGNHRNCVEHPACGLAATVLCNHERTPRWNPEQDLYEQMFDLSVLEQPKRPNLSTKLSLAVNVVVVVSHLASGPKAGRRLIRCMERFATA